MLPFTHDAALSCVFPRAPDAGPILAEDRAWAPLHLAARPGHTDTVGMLLAMGACAPPLGPRCMLLVITELNCSLASQLRPCVQGRMPT